MQDVEESPEIACRRDAAGVERGLLLHVGARRADAMRFLTAAHRSTSSW